MIELAIWPKQHKLITHPYNAFKEKLVVLLLAEHQSESLSLYVWLPYILGIIVLLPQINKNSMTVCSLSITCKVQNICSCIKMGVYLYLSHMGLHSLLSWLHLFVPFAVLMGEMPKGHGCKRIPFSSDSN